LSAADSDLPYDANRDKEVFEMIGMKFCCQHDQNILQWAHRGCRIARRSNGFER
jgi:hypothetical protein